MDFIGGERTGIGGTLGRKILKVFKSFKFFSSAFFVFAGLFWAILEEFWEAKGLSSHPGGVQVDGSPPASSTDQSLEDGPGETELFGNFRKFF